MNKLPTLGLLAALATVPVLGHAESRAGADPAANAAPTIVYGPPVVYYGDDWERPNGTHERREQKQEQFARAKALAGQSELAAAQWQASDYSGR